MASLVITLLYGCIAPFFGGVGFFTGAAAAAASTFFLSLLLCAELYYKKDTSKNKVKDNVRSCLPKLLILTFIWIFINSDV
jgi:hypothetical protein